jgi:hypothetical protein
MLVPTVGFKTREAKLLRTDFNTPFSYVRADFATFSAPIRPVDSTGGV